ncbi:hypothetical protein DFQ26_002989 [Actinomortierella ambigua]|nr:hypothetical protein DFQ26_002989 [Actinomortierella ambigua]
MLAFLVILVVMYQFQEYSFLRGGHEQDVARQESLKDIYPPVSMPNGAKHQNQPDDMEQHVGDDASALPQKPQLPRIFDIILLNNEMEQLEIRLGELHDVVDVFVIVETKKTFSLRDKPLHYRIRQHEERFAKYRNKILHIVVPEMTSEESSRVTRVGGYGWEYETFVRSKAIETLIDTFRPSEGDWLLLSDLDEVPKPAVLAQLKRDPSSISTKVLNPRKNYRHTAALQRHTGLSFVRLECDFYYYSYEFKHRGNWVGPILARFEEPEAGVDPFLDDQKNYGDDGMLIFDKFFWHDYTNMGYRMRMMLRLDGDVHMVPNSCWHCSWCFSNITDIQNKAASYSHREHADSHFMQSEWILNHVRDGIDLFERGSEVYDYIKDNKDVPSYVATHADKFSHQLHRKDKYNAGFKDVSEKPPGATGK